MADAQVPDAFQPYYDLMVNWERRLAHEAPFFQRVFASAKVRRVLDCACGTGHHVRLFSQWRLEVAGSDLSPAMIQQASRDAKLDGADVRFEVADFRDLADSFGEPFDAIICTGNSLSLAGSKDGVRRAVGSIYEVLAPGGVAILHVLNYARMPEGRNLYEEPRVRVVDDNEILFLKVTRKVRRRCDLDIIVLEKQAGEWTKLESHAQAVAIEQPELKTLATDAGFVRLQFYGGYEPKPFDPDTSRDLILVARKKKSSK